MKNTKSMISTIYQTLHVSNLDKLKDLYKNWNDYENDVINLAGYVGHKVTTDTLFKYLKNKQSKIFDSWEELRYEWFNTPSQFKSHTEVLDKSNIKKKKTNGGFK